LAPLVASMSLGFTSPALDTMLGRGAPGASAVPPELLIFGGAAGPDDQAASLFSSLVNIGALVGAVCGGRLCKQAGRCNALRAAAVLMGACWWWVALATSALHLCLARVVMGLGVGLQSVATPTYIAEVSPPEWRGMLGTMNAGAILLGVMVVDFAGGSVFRAGPAREFCHWRQLACFVAVSAVVLLGAAAVLPEPSAGRRRSSAEQSPGPASPETPAIHLTPSESLLPPARLVLGGLVPMVWQQLSGVNAVLFFGQSILRAVGVAGADLLGVGVLAVQLCGIVVAACIIDLVGRRPLLLGSSMGMAAGAGGLAVCLWLPEPPAVGVVGCLCVYVLSFSLGLGPVPWLLLPELDLPHQVRVTLASVATAANWACSFVVTGPPLVALQGRCGLAGVFAVFCVVCLVGAVLMALLVPETKAHQRRQGLERRFTFAFSPHGSLRSRFFTP